MSDLNRFITIYNYSDSFHKIRFLISPKKKKKEGGGARDPKRAPAATIILKSSYKLQSIAILG